MLNYIDSRSQEWIEVRLKDILRSKVFAIKPSTESESFELKAIKKICSSILCEEPPTESENFVQLPYNSSLEQNEVGILTPIDAIPTLFLIVVLIKCINNIFINKFFWRVSIKTKYYLIALLEYVRNKLTFVKHFLENKKRNGRTGVLSNNPLITAAKDNKKEVIEEHLKYCFDTDYEDNNGFNAIDYAWMNYINPVSQNYKEISNEIILMLLKSNWKFPKTGRNVGFNRREASPEVREFIKQSESLRVYVRNNNIEGLKYIINKFPYLRHFYDLKNVSILQYSMIINNEEAFNLLTSHHIITGSHEGQNEAIRFFQKREMILMNTRSTAIIQNNFVFQLSNLFRSTNEHNDDLKAIMGSILSRFNVLSNSEISLIILEIAAANRNFKIFLDFSQEPSNYFNKVTSGRDDIYIAAQCAVDDVIVAVISKICDFVADITCLEYSNKFPQNIGLAKILKYYCGIQQLTECLTKFLSNGSLRSNLEDDLKKSLHILIKLRNGHPSINFGNITPPMQEYILHMKGCDVITAAKLSSNEIYATLLQKT